MQANNIIKTLAFLVSFDSIWGFTKRFRMRGTRMVWILDVHYGIWAKAVFFDLSPILP
jgi:hypothetical protein